MACAPPTMEAMLCPVISDRVPGKVLPAAPAAIVLDVSLLTAESNLNACRTAGSCCLTHALCILEMVSPRVIRPDAFSSADLGASF